MSGGRPKAGVTFWDRVLAKTVTNNRACLEFTGHRDACGYGRINKNGKLVRIHREAWIESVGPIPDGFCVCHTCDNPACWNIAHLFLGTHAENMADMKAKGRARGAPREENAAAKLTGEQVDEIRRIKSLPNRTVAEIYGVSKSLIGAIKRREVWA